MEFAVIFIIIAVVVAVLLGVGRVGAPRANPGSREAEDLAVLRDSARLEQFAKKATDYDRVLALVVSAFLWKVEGKEPERAQKMACSVIYMREAGSPESKADANAICKAAYDWSLQIGDQAIRWGVECGALAEGRESPWAE